MPLTSQRCKREENETECIRTQRSSGDSSSTRENLNNNYIVLCPKHPIVASCREGVVSVPEWRSSKARKVLVRVKTSSRTDTDTVVVLDVAAVGNTSSKDKRERMAALTKKFLPHWTKEWRRKASYPRHSNAWLAQVQNSSVAKRGEHWEIWHAC